MWRNIIITIIKMHQLEKHAALLTDFILLIGGIALTFSREKNYGGWEGAL